MENILKALQWVLKVAGLIIKVITWLITNGLPFVRGIIEEFKSAKAKKALKK